MDRVNPTAHGRRPSTLGSRRPDAMQPPDLRVFILAGGLGTRLRPASGTQPKGLMPIGGQPFLRRLLERLAAQNLRECVLCLGYGAREIMDYFDAHPLHAMRLHYSIESELRGTAGALRVAQSYWAETNLILNGDTELVFNFAQLEEAHRARRADVTIGLAQVADASPYGRAQLADDGRVLAFLEKDSAAQRGLVNAGLYLATRHALNEIPEHGSVSMERDWLPALVRDGRAVFGCVVADEFTDIGTPDNYWRLAKRT